MEKNWGDTPSATLIFAKRFEIYKQQIHIHGNYS